MSSTWVNSDFSAIHYLARKRQVVEPFHFNQSGTAPFVRSTAALP